MVLAPGRGLAYHWLAEADPDLADALHERRCGPYGMVPFGYSAPRFPHARLRKGAYAAGGAGFVEFGSPLPEVMAAWTWALQDREYLDWGGVALRITRVQVFDPPRFASGTTTLRTTTPVIMKVSGDDQRRASPWVLPTEAGFASAVVHNLRRKAETLGLSPDIDLQAITWVGAQRSFTVGQGAKPGAPIEACLSGEPETLQAIWSWGLGQANSAGFGWIGGEAR